MFTYVVITNCNVNALCMNMYRTKVAWRCSLVSPPSDLWCFRTVLVSTRFHGKYDTLSATIASHVSFLLLLIASEIGGMVALFRALDLPFTGRLWPGAICSGLSKATYTCVPLSFTEQYL